MIHLNPKLKEFFVFTLGFCGFDSWFNFELEMFLKRPVLYFGGAI